MTYLDSNILIRVITGDTPDVANKLLTTIDNAKKHEYVVEPVVIAEVCFVLEFHDYAMKRVDIADALTDFISAPQIVANANIIAAIEMYKKYPRLDFTDCWLAILAANSNAGLLSLDKDLNKVFASQNLDKPL